MLTHLGAGLLLTLIFTKIYSLDFTLSLLAINIFFSYIPDIDTIFELISRKRIGGKVQGFHREITHYPAIYIPVALLIYFIWGSMWAVIFSLNLLIHHILDSFDGAWGIKWLWPISKKRYKFFADQKTGKVSSNFIASWEDKELNLIVAKYGDNNWFRNRYLRVTPTLIFEVSSVIIGLILLLVYLNG